LDIPVPWVITGILLRLHVVRSLHVRENPPSGEGHCHADGEKKPTWIFRTDLMGLTGEGTFLTLVTVVCVIMAEYFFEKAEMLSESQKKTSKSSLILGSDPYTDGIT
jgi:hypothetical protein